MGVGSAKRYEGVCWDDAFLFMYDLFLLRLLIKKFVPAKTFDKKNILTSIQCSF